MLQLKSSPTFGAEPHDGRIDWAAGIGIGELHFDLDSLPFVVCVCHLWVIHYGYEEEIPFVYHYQENVALVYGDFQ